MKLSICLTITLLVCTQALSLRPEVLEDQRNSVTFVKPEDTHVEWWQLPYAVKNNNVITQRSFGISSQPQSDENTVKDILKNYTVTGILFNKGKDEAIMRLQANSTLPQEVFTVKDAFFFGVTVRGDIMYDFKVIIETAHSQYYITFSVSLFPNNTDTSTLQRFEVVSVVYFNIWPTSSTPVAVTFKNKTSYFNTDFILNNKFSEQVFEGGMKYISIPNVYYKVINHTLISVTIGENFMSYTFTIELLYGSGHIKQHNQTVVIGIENFDFFSHRIRPSSMMRPDHEPSDTKDPIIFDSMVEYANTSIISPKYFNTTDLIKNNNVVKSLKNTIEEMLNKNVSADNNALRIQSIEVKKVRFDGWHKHISAFSMAIYAGAEYTFEVIRGTESKEKLSVVLYMNANYQVSVKEIKQI